MGGDPGSVLARLVDASMIEAHFDGGTRYRMLETLRAYGLDRLVATGEHEAAAGRLLGWAVDLTARIEEGLRSTREPEFDAVLRRELPNLRAAWRLARQPRNPSMSRPRWSSDSSTPSAYRDLIETPRLGRGTGRRIRPWPPIRARTAVLGIAAEAAYHRGDHRRAEHLARAGLALVTDADDRGAVCCRCRWSTWPEARTRMLSSTRLAPAAFAPHPRENYGVGRSGHGVRR